jgi:hypothetical protein
MGVFQNVKIFKMRIIAGLLAYLAVVLIAVIMLLIEWIKKRKHNIR